MKQNMSRVGKCIDNRLMEKFRGMIKRERYYGKRFTRRTSLVNMMESYIKHYNNKRLQRHLGVLNPMGKSRTVYAVNIKTDTSFRLMSEI